jgi:hypothetical protein
MNTIEQKRIRYKRSLQEDLKNSELYITRTNATLKRIRNSNSNTEFYKTKVVDYTQSIEEREETVKVLQHKIHLVETRQLDDEILELYSAQNNDVIAKNNANKREKIVKKAEKTENSSISMAYYQAGRKCDRQNRWKKKDAAYHYRRLCRTKLPEYMMKKLKKMPNNKGYLWNGIYYFGDKPAEKDRHTIIFTRKRNNKNLFIHEWKPNFTVISEKDHITNKTTVVERIPRRKIGLANRSIGSFV